MCHQAWPRLFRRDRHPRPVLEVDLLEIADAVFGDVVADPRTNAKFKMSFFGGIISQDYVVVEHRPEQGWLVLATANGKYLWLMSQKPVLPAAIKTQALTRIRQLGFDIGRLEFPLPRS